MDWTKWDLKKILEQPLIPMMLCLEYATGRYIKENEQGGNKIDSPAPFDMRNMRSMQQVISSGRK